MPTLPVQVYIVDDKPSICAAYARLLRSVGMQPQTFRCIEDFLISNFSDQNACVICEVHLPDRSGLELPRLLYQAGHQLPVIFVTACNSTEIRDLARRIGATGFFQKPVDDQALVDVILWSLKARTDREAQN